MIGSVGLTVGVTWSHICDTLGSSQGERPLPCKHHSWLMWKRCFPFLICPAHLSYLRSNKSFVIHYTAMILAFNLFLQHTEPSWKIFLYTGYFLCSWIFVWLDRGLSLAVTSPEKPCLIIHFKVTFYMPGSLHPIFLIFLFFHSIFHHLKLYFSFNIFMYLLFVRLHIV